MIYSIVPNDIIYYDENKYNDSKLKDMYYKGQLIQYIENEQGERILERVLSTDLKSYLDKDYQPGCVIKQDFEKNTQ